MSAIDFTNAFTLLTGNAPFPWQTALYERFTSGRADNIPASCNLPTGLGKTSVIAVWLIAFANGAKVPRRLVYVVNRRTVVDQTTDEVEKYRKHLTEKPELRSFSEKLEPLALSTLRGQFADNREWSADPSRSAVICGTVDMIGSRLLFNGYGVGFKGKPLHAGFLGQDSLLVHDEAHLEPAFQTLIEAIRDEQSRCRDFRPMRVMELTATSRGKVEPFGLTDKDRDNAVVRERITATKTIHLTSVADPKKLAEQLAATALKYDDKGRAVLVFARTVDDVMRIRDKLPKRHVETLTGTMRGKERDDLVENALFKRFMPGGQSDEQTSYLVCTSAGEVGVNISADHLVCDLSTLDSMAQRFGRVNRFGKRTDSEIHVIHPSDNQFEDDEYDQRRKATFELLRQLKGDGSPDALGKLNAESRQAAFAPTPTILPTSDILFDSWALTTIRDKLPGRPPVEPYLHGLPTVWQPPETQVAWRDEVSRITGDLVDQYPPNELLDEYPLKPHELLREPSYRAFKQFEAMAKRLGERVFPAWLIDDDGNVRVLTLSELANKDNKELIEGKTVLLPPAIGGLEGGMLTGSSALDAEDVADDWYVKDRDGKRIRRRKRLLDEDPEDDLEVEKMHTVLTIRFPSNADDEDDEGDEWIWLRIVNEGDKSAKAPVLWEVHVGDVELRTAQTVDALALGDSLPKLVKLAAKYHDHGKRRKLFQIVLGNSNTNVCWAKSGKHSGRIAETFRHEFGSLIDVETEQEFAELSPDEKELVLHLIATHHGRGRPHFPADEAFDPERPGADAERVAADVPRRFARLQRKYGRWGLAYLESLLRAADWAASANPSEFFMEGE
jgi:CRISPR-associated endonuclease/helicase Cas3